MKRMKDRIWDGLRVMAAFAIVGAFAGVVAIVGGDGSKLLAHDRPASIKCEELRVSSTAGTLSLRDMCTGRLVARIFKTEGGIWEIQNAVNIRSDPIPDFSADVGAGLHQWMWVNGGLDKCESVQVYMAATGVVVVRDMCAGRDVGWIYRREGKWEVLAMTIPPSDPDIWRRWEDAMRALYGPEFIGPMNLASGGWQL